MQKYLANFLLKIASPVRSKIKQGLFQPSFKITEQDCILHKNVLWKLKNLKHDSKGKVFDKIFVPIKY